MGTFFDLGNATPTQNGKDLLAALAQEIGKLPNRVSVEGHTDSQAYQSQSGYTNWELSVDRANTARRLKCSIGLRSDQVEQVRGFADQHLRLKDKPADSANRRISVIVQYLEVPIGKLSEVTEPSSEASPQATETSTSK